MMDRPWMLDDLPVGVWVGRVPDGTPAYTNKMFERIMGMPPADVPVGDAARTYGLVDREGRPYPADRLPFARVVAARGPVVVDDVVLRRPGGDINIRAFGSPVFEPDGTMSHVIVAFSDITKEVAAEAGRRTMEERLLFACNHAPIVIWMTDTEGTVTLSEGAGLASLGVKSGDLVGKNLLELYAAHPTIPGYIRRGLAGESLWYTVEVGEAVYETWVAPVRDSSGKMIAMAALSNDVSQLRKLQRTAIQNDRVIAMGTLAASVAHEINNPLTYVLSHGDALADELAGLERLLGSDAANLTDVRASVARLREGLAPIRTGTSRIAAITRDLRSFSRPDERSMAPVNLRAVVESVLKLVAKEVEARARLLLDLQDTAPVIGNEARLIQVVLNLIVNAYQALPPDSAAYHQVAVSARNDGARVVVEVSDSGPGVPVADRERIFEPFFSTKEIGIGTGLGLFVCRNIVRGFSGDVEVADRPGGGALFRVVLPAVSAPVPPAAAAGAGTAPVQKATGKHVILIEDDRLVARAFSLQLGQAGYRVSTFGDGQSGMRALLETNDFDLVFCDLMMTGMTGMDLAEQLAKQAPEKAERLVLMTGGAFSSRARDFVALHRDRTVDKPFDIVAETQKRLAAAQSPSPIVSRS
jgi:signal transduction histidine kinase/ActR/RegA family two-component response regulator